MDIEEANAPGAEPPRAESSENKFWGAPAFGIGLGNMEPELPRPDRPGDPDGGATTFARELDIEEDNAPGAEPARAENSDNTVWGAPAANMGPEPPRLGTPGNTDWGEPAIGIGGGNLGVNKPGAEKPGDPDRGAPAFGIGLGNMEPEPPRPGRPGDPDGGATTFGRGSKLTFTFSGPPEFDEAIGLDIEEEVKAAGTAGKLDNPDCGTATLDRGGKLTLISSGGNGRCL